MTMQDINRENRFRTLEQRVDKIYEEVLAKRPAGTDVNQTEEARLNAVQGKLDEVSNKLNPPAPVEPAAPETDITDPVLPLPVEEKDPLATGPGNPTHEPTPPSDPPAPVEAPTAPVAPEAPAETEVSPV